VFEHRRHLTVVRAAGAAFDEATLSGGGARSAFWAQMFADCLGVPVSVAEAEEAGALGAALGAGIGAGIFAGYEDAVASMTRIRRVFEPNADLKAHYDHRYDVHLGLVAALQGFWSRHTRSGPNERKEAV